MSEGLISTQSMGDLPKRSRARRVVNVLLNVLGVIAAVLGIYFVFELISVIVMFASFVHPKQPTGPAGLALAVVGMLGFFGIVVFGMLAGVCITIAAWILEPVRRWRDWRARLRGNNSAPAPSSLTNYGNRDLD